MTKADMTTLADAIRRANRDRQGNRVAISIAAMLSHRIAFFDADAFLAACGCEREVTK